MDHTEDMMDQGVSGGEVGALQSSTAANAHTPGPWIAHSGAYPYGWKGDIFAKDAKSIMDATHIARCNPKKPGHQFIDELHAIAWEREQAPIVEANAAFIVRACNNHYKLLAALKQIATMQDGEQAWWARDIANAALATVEGK